MENRNKILILGGSSYVGRNLFARLGPDGAIATYCGTPIPEGVHFDALSMSLAEAIDTPERISHAVILLGITRPDSCAADTVKSRALNVDSIKSIIQQLRQWGIKPVFTSTESVFDGVKGGYIESDPARPTLIYGQQKVEIEEFLRNSGQGHMILRLALVYGAESGDGTLLTKWLQAIDRNEIIRVATDQICSPVYINDVVDAIIRLIQVDASGLFHISSRRPLSRQQCLQKLMDQLDLPKDQLPEVVQCSIHDFDLLEKRPLDLSMRPDKLVEACDLQITEVEDVCRELAESRGHFEFL